MIAGQIALIVAAIFTGAAAYVSFAEQPARLTLDDRSALAEWKPAYQRGFAMQGPLLCLASCLGSSPGGRQEIGAAVGRGRPHRQLALHAHRHHADEQPLMATPLDQAGPESRKLIETWAGFHAVRTGLGRSPPPLPLGERRLGRIQFGEAAFRFVERQNGAAREVEMEAM